MNFRTTAQLLSLSTSPSSTRLTGPLEGSTTAIRAHVRSTLVIDPSELSLESMGVDKMTFEQMEAAAHHLRDLARRVEQYRYIGMERRQTLLERLEDKPALGSLRKFSEPEKQKL